MVTNMRNAMMAGKPLPYDAEVEYLESTRTQWIDTGLAPTNVGIWELDIQYTTVELQSWGNSVNGVFGATNQRFDIGTNYNEIKFSLNIGRSATLGTLDTSRHVFRLDNVDGRIWVDELSKAVSKVSFSATSPILIGARSYYAGNMSYTLERIYASKMYDASRVFVRDLIPVRFTNELGVSEGAMYDRVTGELFRNSGTGAFIIGPDAVSSAGGGGISQNA